MDHRAIQDVRRGLLHTPRSLPPHIFYDAEGSRLFESICELPEYYVTRSEREVFEQHADEMAALLGRVDHVVELGAGSATKTGLLLRAILRDQPRVVFHPVDVSAEALRMATTSLHGLLPDLEVRPIEGQYDAALKRVARLEGRKLMLFIGSSLGNFEPDEAAAFLDGVRAAIASDDALLLGTDLPKDRSLLVPAYDDRRGVTAAFNRNALIHINRELGGDFQPAKFRHVALWNQRESRMEMHLESVEEQRVHIDALELTLTFGRHERIHTENSYKFAPDVVRRMLRHARFEVEADWRDEHGWFADWLALAT